MKTKENVGITLIALVLTIIVLLILASISVSMLIGENGILTRAKEAKEKTEAVQASEEKKLKDYKNIIEQNVDKIPEGLQIGSTVLYSTSGEYNWQAKYCSTTKTEDAILSSASGESFNLTEWKVLSIENGKVELVPENPTEGMVYLGEAQGYNNGVKLLNDACDSLYSSVGVTARSLNIDDIEKYMKLEKIDEIYKYQFDSTTAKYGTQLTNAYSTNKSYPIIYAKEILSVINEIEKKDGLKRSEQSEWIEKTSDGVANGVIASATSIRPYQTYWNKDNLYVKTAFKKEGGIDYYDLLIKPSKKYWIASRCIATYSSNCGFYMHYVYNGAIGGGDMYGSDGNVNNHSQSIFPILSLNAGLITVDQTGRFVIEN